MSGGGGEEVTGVCRGTGESSSSMGLGVSRGGAGAPGDEDVSEEVSPRSDVLAPTAFLSILQSFSGLKINMQLRSSTEYKY